MVPGHQSVPHTHQIMHKHEIIHLEPPTWKKQPAKSLKSYKKAWNQYSF